MNGCFGRVNGEIVIDSYSFPKEVQIDHRGTSSLIDWIVRSESFLRPQRACCAISYISNTPNISNIFYIQILPTTKLMSFIPNNSKKEKKMKLQQVEAVMKQQ